MKHPRVAITVVAAGMVACAGLAVTALDAATGPIATLDERAITEQEIAFHAGLLQSMIENEVRTGRVTDADAESELRDRALDAAIADAELFDLAHEHGIVAWDDFDGFLDDLDRENADRDRDLASGEVVYGTTRFDAEEYWSRAVTTAREDLIRELAGAGGALEISASDVDREFAAHPDQWEAAGAEYDVRVVSVPASEAVGACAGEFEQAAVDGVLAACPTATEELTTVNGADPAPAQSPTAQLLASVADLDVGQVTPALVDGDSVQVVQLSGKRVDTDAARAAYDSMIRYTIGEQRLDDLLATRTADAAISVDSARLNAVDLEEKLP